MLRPDKKRPPRMVERPRTPGDQSRRSKALPTSRPCSDARESVASARATSASAASALARSRCTAVVAWATAARATVDAASAALALASAATARRSVSAAPGSRVGGPALGLRGPGRLHANAPSPGTGPPSSQVTASLQPRRWATSSRPARAPHAACARTGPATSTGVRANSCALPALP